MKIEADKKRRAVIIDGQYYVLEEDDEGNRIIVKIDVKEYDKKIKELSEKLVDAVDKNMLITDVLLGLTKKDMYDLHDKLFKSKRKPKPKMQPGCVEMKIGNTIIPIRD